MNSNPTATRAVAVYCASSVGKQKAYQDAALCDYLPIENRCTCKLILINHSTRQSFGWPGSTLDIWWWPKWPHGHCFRGGSCWRRQGHWCHPVRFHRSRRRTGQNEHGAITSSQTCISAQRARKCDRLITSAAVLAVHSSFVEGEHYPCRLHA